MFFKLLGFIFLFSVISVENIYSQVINSFDSDSQGWTTTSDATGFPIPVYQSIGGNPGGYIEAVDQLSGNYFFFVAGSDFLGDLSQWFGDTLSYEIRSSFAGNANPSLYDISITGAGIKLVADQGSITTADVWIKKSIPLSIDGNWKITSLTGTTATSADIEMVLSSVTEITIRGEYTTSKETVGLDNVGLGTPTGLPVELTSFNLSKNSGGINLTWTTASESNNAGWEVEVYGNPLNPPLIKGETSENSKTLAPPFSKGAGGFRKVGFIPGKGTTTDAQNYQFQIPQSELKGTKLWFRLKQLDFDGTASYSNVLTYEEIPETFSVGQNYPNPFNPSTAISFQLSAASHVKIVISDVLGREVATILNQEKSAGVHTVNFDGKNLTSGLYFYTVTANGKSITKSMMLMK